MSNYRTITILRCSILNCRLNDFIYTVLGEYQAGFCTMCVTILSRVHQGSHLQSAYQSLSSIIVSQDLAFNVYFLTGFMLLKAVSVY